MSGMFISRANALKGNKEGIGWCVGKTLLQMLLLLLLLLLSYCAINNSVSQSTANTTTAAEQSMKEICKIGFQMLSKHYIAMKSGINTLMINQTATNNSLLVIWCLTGIFCHYLRLQACPSAFLHLPAALELTWTTLSSDKYQLQAWLRRIAQSPGSGGISLWIGLPDSHHW